MDWIRSFQRSIDYIEENIAEPITVEEAARQMNISPFYYQKIFSIICGFSVGEYIRNRRLSIAGSELARTDEKIIGIALKYQYNTPEGFTRAFTKFHGASPSAVKKGAPIRSFSRLSVTISMKGGNTMNYKIVKKEAFKVIEKRTTQSVSESENTIPEFWDRALADGTVKKLTELSAEPDPEIFGICYAHTHAESSTFDYAIAVKTGGGAEAPEGYTANEIPARTWAVFSCKGAIPNAIQELWHRICTEFFPSSDYEPTYEMDIEVYGSGDMNAPDYQSEIWVPIKESK